MSIKNPVNTFKNGTVENTLFSKTIDDVRFYYFFSNVAKFNNCYSIFFLYLSAFYRIHRILLVPNLDTLDTRG